MSLNQLFHQAGTQISGGKSLKPSDPIWFRVATLCPNSHVLPSFSWSHSYVAIGTVITPYSYPCISDLQTALLQLRPQKLSHMAGKSSTWGKIWQNICLMKQIATFIHFKVSILIFKPLNVIWNLCVSTYRIIFVYMAMMSLSLWNHETAGGKEEIWSGILRIFTEVISKLQVSYPGDKSY